MAISKKFAIFAQSLWNLEKIVTSWLGDIAKIWAQLDQNYGFFTYIQIFFGFSTFLLLIRLIGNKLKYDEEKHIVSAPIQPHSWIKPHPLSFHAKNNFLCVFYMVIWGQKSVRKNRTPGLHSSRYGNLHRTLALTNWK